MVKPKHSSPTSHSGLEKSGTESERRLLCLIQPAVFQDTQVLPIRRVIWLLLTGSVGLDLWLEEKSTLVAELGCKAPPQ